MGASDGIQPLRSAFASLFASPTQHARLLKLHTPLGPDVLLAERLDGVEAIGPAPDLNAPRAGFRFVVDALCVDTHLSLKRLIGQPALLELLTPHGAAGGAGGGLGMRRPFHGHITRAGLLGSDGGLARFRLVIEPWLALLAERRDAWVFQGLSVPQIIEDVFADHAGAAHLAPAWRWSLADPAAYPQRSLCIQYHESDLAFVQRLLREEGLFCWFEHAGAPEEPALGRHTLVIADHNGAFAPNAQPRVRYTRGDAQLGEDSLDRWSESVRLTSTAIELASPDYRSLALRPVQAAVDGTADIPVSLTVADIPGAYAYEDSAQGQRLVQRQAEALAAHAASAQGRGTWRCAAPGTTFTLGDHPEHRGHDEARDRHVILAVRHRARNNLHADAKAAVPRLAATLGREARGPQAPDALPDRADEPVYGCELQCQRAALPVRMARTRPRGDLSEGEAYGSFYRGIGGGSPDEHGDEEGDGRDGSEDDDGADGFASRRPDIRLHPRPTVHGVQTALVVGLQAPVHTDRDHRIKVQFHWQRGASGSHRLDPPSRAYGPGNAGPGNAPASAGAGTWVRVAENVAGANWGSNFTPRLGQEVLVGFIEGDIDRPVVLGSVYNGIGQEDAQFNRIASGAAGATGNAPAWFPGGERAGAHRGHQHAAVLSGYKSQALADSRTGTGGHNQLVFDDSAGRGRIELATTSAQTRLQLGHLLQQEDNRLLQPRGHGLDLRTDAWGALRAGSGLLISAHGRPGSLTGSPQMDVAEPLARLQQATELAHALADSAQRQEARLQGEPDTQGAGPEDTKRHLPFEQGLRASEHSLQGQDHRGDAHGELGGRAGTRTGHDNPPLLATGGGTGTVPALARPDLVIAAPAGIAAFTPAHATLSAGRTASVVAQDVQQLSLGHQATVAARGLVFYTSGQPGAADRPVQDTGIQWHAASGSFSSRSLDGATRVMAQQAVEVTSTQGMVKVAAPGHVLLTAAGAAIRIEGGNITLSGPGKVEFRASMKELAGPGSASQGLELKKPGPYKLCEFTASAAAQDGAAFVTF